MPVIYSLGIISCRDRLTFYSHCLIHPFLQTTDTLFFWFSCIFLYHYETCYHSDQKPLNRPSATNLFRKSLFVSQKGGGSSQQLKTGFLSAGTCMSASVEAVTVYCKHIMLNTIKIWSGVILWFWSSHIYTFLAFRLMWWRDSSIWKTIGGTGHSLGFRKGLQTGSAGCELRRLMDRTGKVENEQPPPNCWFQEHSTWQLSRDHKTFGTAASWDP